MDNLACHACRFWWPHDGSRPGDRDADVVAIEIDGNTVDVAAYGQCRRNPPVISDHMASIAIRRPGFGGNEIDPEDIAVPSAVQQSCLWPVLYCTDWCGEHRPRAGEKSHVQ